MRLVLWNPVAGCGVRVLWARCDPTRPLLPAAVGKTAQAIAHLAQLLEAGECGPHLIVAPVSTLANWRRELARWCPALRVVQYYGSEAERASILDDLRYACKGGAGERPHVVLGAYTLFERDNEKSRTERVRLGRLFEDGYVVLDEAQQVGAAPS